MLGWLVNYAYVHTYIYTWTDGTTSLRSFMTPVVLSCEATRVRVLFPPPFFLFFGAEGEGTKEDHKQEDRRGSKTIRTKAITEDWKQGSYVNQTRWKKEARVRAENESKRENQSVRVYAISQISFYFFKGYVNFNFSRLGFFLFTS